MTETEALVGLNLVSAIGSRRLKKLLEVFDKPQNILNACVDKLKGIEGIGEGIAQQIISLKNADIEREFELINKYNLHLLTVYDRDYPKNLNKIYDPPLILYLKGKLSPQDELSIAIVGSRRASFYGLTNAERFAYELASRGFTIVSGLAYGIDTQAHKGALRAAGRTIAVLGSGLANIYPAENEELVQRISQQGAVISEFPLHAAPLPQNFPRRNRVISGLCLGIVVVEAARNSGALITADFALEQGREVFALPGEIDSSTSFGTNGLIKQGAKLVSHIEEIIEELNMTNLSNACLEETDCARKLNSDSCGIEVREESRQIFNLTNEESVLYNSLSTEPLYLDDIVDRLGSAVPQVLTTLLALEMKKLIRQLPGKQFARIENA